MKNSKRKLDKLIDEKFPNLNITLRKKTNNYY